MQCAIPSCPALTVGRAKYCQPHSAARTAKELGIAKDALTGNGGERCASCRKRFAETDFVRATRVETTKARKKVLGHQHVACEPPTARMAKAKQRESEKPLFADVS